MSSRSGSAAWSADLAGVALGEAVGGVGGNGHVVVAVTAGGPGGGDLLAGADGDGLLVSHVVVGGQRVLDRYLALVGQVDLEVPGVACVDRDVRAGDLTGVLACRNHSPGE